VMSTGRKSIAFRHTTSTPVVSANNIAQEIDVNGQLIITGSSTGIQTAEIYVNWALDNTYNSGLPFPGFVLTVTESGFVDVPPGGQIYGWQVQSDVIGPPGASQGAVAYTNGTTYTPGTTFYGPTVNSSTSFTYNPATAAFLTLYFRSNFDGNAGQYTWDFPLKLKAAAVPEPSTSLAAICALSALLLRRRSKLTIVN